MPQELADHLKLIFEAVAGETLIDGSAESRFSSVDEFFSRVGRENGSVSCSSIAERRVEPIMAFAVLGPHAAP